MVDFEIKDCYKFDDLLRIMEILRAPDGCIDAEKARISPPTFEMLWSPGARVA